MTPCLSTVALVLGLLQLELAAPFDIQEPARWAVSQTLSQSPSEQDARRLSTLAITDPAAYQAELRARGLWPVDLDEYLKRDRTKDP